MSVSITVSADTGGAVGVATGELSLDDMKSAGVALWKNPDFLGKSILWDLRNATFSLATDEVTDLAQFAKSRSTLGRGARMAFVVGGELEFGLARMFEVFRQQPGLEIRVFRRIEEATAWVQDIEQEVP